MGALEDQEEYDGSEVVSEPEDSPVEDDKGKEIVNADKSVDNIKRRTLIPVRLTEEGGLPDNVVVHTVGEWEHPFYGTISMSREKMNKMVKNWKQKLMHPGADQKAQLHIDFEHKLNTGDAAAWVGGLKRIGDHLVFTDLEWTDVGQAAMLGKRFKFMSADYYEDYFPTSKNLQRTKGDKVLGYGPSIAAAALTNRPFIKELPVIMSEDGKIKQEMNFVKEDDIIVLDIGANYKDSGNKTLTEDNKNNDKVVVLETPDVVKNDNDMNVIHEENKLPDKTEPSTEPIKAEAVDTVDKAQFDSVSTQLDAQRKRGDFFAGKWLEDRIAIISKSASDRSVPPVVTNAVLSLMKNCDVTEAPSYKLQDGDKEVDANLFEALMFLMEKMPDLSKLATETTDGNTSVKSPLKVDTKPTVEESIARSRALAEEVIGRKITDEEMAANPFLEMANR